MTNHPLLGTSLLVALVLLSACASDSIQSARPVLYPNPKLQSVGQAGANQEIQVCLTSAQTAGLTPELPTHAVAKGATAGAAVGGVATAVGAAVSGRNLGSILSAGAKGAAVGGAAGGVNGAFNNEKVNPTYRAFVQRCLRDKGFDVIGWQ